MKIFNASAVGMKKLAIGALAVSAVAVGGVATFANFTDSATSPITVTAGKIDLKLNSVNSFPIDLGSTMKPGDSVVRTVSVQNNGTIPLTYTANTTGATGTLAPVVDVKIEDVTGTASTIGTTKLNAMVLPSKIIAGGSKQDLKLTFTWVSGTPAVDNPLQGGTAAATLNLSATQ